MKTTSFLAILTLSCSALLLHAETPTPTPAATPPAALRADEKAPKKGPFKGIIETLTADKGMFTIANKESGKVKTYALALTAKVTKGDKPATLAEAKVGDEVRGSGLKTGDAAYEVYTLKIGPKTAEELAEDKKKKDDKATAKMAP